MWEDFYTWQETVEAEAQAAEEVALLRQNLVNAKHRANMTAGALDQMTRQRNEQRGMAREASAQARLSMRDLNLVKEKYRAVASGVQPCASYAAALDDSIGWRYAGKDEAKRLVACLRAG